jgi:hypothetical protein
VGMYPTCGPLSTIKYEVNLMIILNICRSVDSKPSGRDFMPTIIWDH